MFIYFYAFCVFISEADLSEADLSKSATGGGLCDPLRLLFITKKYVII
jgi:hypothetical protein